MSKETFIPTLKYRADSKFAPIPPWEADLQTVVAEPWLQVGTDPLILEGVTFDAEGNMWFIEDTTSRAHKVNMETKEDTIVYVDPEKRSMSSCKHHANGKVYIPSVGTDFEHGYVFTMNPDGTDYQVLLEGHVFDDLTFDSKGGFYYTHFYGSVPEPKGGVYYVAPDGKTVTPLLEGLAGPNGVALSKDEKVVWITESNAMALTRVELTGNGPTDIAPFGVKQVYHFTGGGCADSCEIDADDNLYVAMYNQGRVLVFNAAGYPIGQVLIPGRENGNLLRSTHPFVRPGTNELYICTHDDENGAWIFRAGAFAKGEGHGNGYAYK